MDRFTEALSSTAKSAVEGGASPLPEPSSNFFEDWVSQYFMVIPMNVIREYNHEPVSCMVHRAILIRMGEFDTQAFPPILESWSNPVSMSVKMKCSKKVFDSIREEVTSIYTDFGGRAELIHCYQANEAM
jgi:hypothetical protein